MAGVLDSSDETTVATTPECHKGRSPDEEELFQLLASPDSLNFVGNNNFGNTFDGLFNNNNNTPGSSPKTTGDPLDNLLFRLTVDDPLSLRRDNSSGIFMDSLLLQAWQQQTTSSSISSCETDSSFNQLLLANLTNEAEENNMSSDVPQKRVAEKYGSCDSAATGRYPNKQFKFRLKRGGVKRATAAESEVSSGNTYYGQTNLYRGLNNNTNSAVAPASASIVRGTNSLSAVSTSSDGPTYWGMWEDERNRMLYVSWLPRSGRAVDRASKKRCELVLKEFIGGILGFAGLEKVLLFPPTSAHCKLLFTDEMSARRFLTVFGGEGATLWKCLVCRQFGVDIKDGIQSTKVKVIWADQTKNEAPRKKNHDLEDITPIAARLLRLLQKWHGNNNNSNNITPNAIVTNAASEHLCGLLQSSIA